DGTILFWSQGAEQLYGWSRDDVTGHATHAALHTVFPDRRGAIDLELQRAGHWTGELHQRRKDGTPLWVVSHWTLQEDGQEVVIEVNKDVTALKHVEGALLGSKERLRLGFTGAGLGTCHGVLFTDTLLGSYRGM